MPTCMGNSPAASSAVSMDVDGIDSSLSPIVAPRRRVHPSGLAALDALLGGGFPCRALSQVFLVSVLGLPMRSHVDYDFTGLSSPLTATVASIHIVLETPVEIADEWNRSVVQGSWDNAQRVTHAEACHGAAQQGERKRNERKISVCRLM